MLRRAAIFVVLMGAFAPPAAAQPTELMPGVTYERAVTFTPHGVVVLHEITAPRPGGLYALAPVLAHGTLTGGVEPLTQIERDQSAAATTAGIEGDFFRSADGPPSGVWISGGLLEHPPLASRSSIGIDATGTLRVDRVRLFGTWQGTGQRRTLNGVNQVPAPGQAVLFTAAYGPRTPVVAGAKEVVLGTFPPTSPNVDLAGAVTATASGGGEPIPAGGAVLMAVGAVAQKLQAEAPIGTTIRSRLGLQPTWDGVTAALGGGPLLVRDGGRYFARSRTSPMIRSARALPVPRSASLPTGASSSWPSTAAGRGTARGSRASSSPRRSSGSALSPPPASLQATRSRLRSTAGCSTSRAAAPRPR